MANFKPTWLYIKWHTKTGLFYFGKTIRNPYNYRGSGKYWKDHIEKHGVQYVETVWVKLFEDKEKLQHFALWFSAMNRVTESANWANLKYENGFDGGCEPHKPEVRERIAEKLRGRKRPKDVVERIAEKHRGKVISEQQRNQHSERMRGVPKSPEHKAKIAAAKKGKPRPIEVRLKIQETMRKRHGNNTELAQESTV